MRTKLDLWMKQNRYTDRLFAEAISKDLSRSISARAVYKWRHKLAVPRVAAINAIIRITDNTVTANDFLERS